MHSENQAGAHVFVVEDDPTLSSQITELLQAKGFTTQRSQDGEEALLIALKTRFDLILLDVLLPSCDGFSLLQRLREKCQTPVMMLTACGAEEERIRGFNKGADDYLPKPFNSTELLLRINALLRRSMGKASQQEQFQLSLNGLTMQRQQQLVHYEGQPIQLTPIQFKLLWILARHPGETLSKPYLYQVVLEREYSRHDRSLDMHLSRVRRRLVDAGMTADRLQTMHGTGYSLT